MVPARAVICLRMLQVLLRCGSRGDSWCSLVGVRELGLLEGLFLELVGIQRTGRRQCRRFGLLGLWRAGWSSQIFGVGNLRKSLLLQLVTIGIPRLHMIQS